MSSTTSITAVRLTEVTQLLETQEERSSCFVRIWFCAGKVTAKVEDLWSHSPVKLTLAVTTGHREPVLVVREVAEMLRHEQCAVCTARTPTV